MAAFCCFLGDERGGWYWRGGKQGQQLLGFKGEEDRRWGEESGEEEVYSWLGVGSSGVAMDGGKGGCSCWVGMVCLVDGGGLCVVVFSI